MSAIRQVKLDSPGETRALLDRSRTSVVSILCSPPVGNRPAFGERGEMNAPHVTRMIRTRQWKLCVDAHGPQELYDLENDPDEKRNVAAEPSTAAVRGRLFEQLRRHMRDVGDKDAGQFEK